MFDFVEICEEGKKGSEEIHVLPFGNTKKERKGIFNWDPPINSFHEKKS